MIYLSCFDKCAVNTVYIISSCWT